MRVVTHAVWSSIGALYVVAVALETNARMHAVDVVFVRSGDEVAGAIAAVVARLESRGAAYGQWRKQPQAGADRWRTGSAAPRAARRGSPA